MAKARVQSDDFQATEIELEKLCNAYFVTYKKFDLYESSEETKRRRDMLRAQIRRFVFFSYMKLEEVCLFSQYRSVSISLDCTLWKSD